MSSPAPARETPRVDEVRRIAAVRDPVLRNLQITDCYYRLSTAMAERTGGAANWCTFATWASKQAGQTIRGEDMLDKLASLAARDAQPHHPVRWLWSWLVRRGLFNPDTGLGRIVTAIHSPFDALQLSSAAVARGNLKVFEEIGLEFARYLEQCPRDASVESQSFQKFESALRPGGPPDGQDLLRAAFRDYQQPESGREGQYVFFANLRIGLHEQTRLQPEIREAMEAGPETASDLGKRVLKALFPHLKPGTLVAVAAALLDFPASRLRQYVRDLACRVVTESMMVITIPSLRLDLHRHLDFEFAPSVKNIDVLELQAMLEQFEPPAGKPDDCGATDWSNLAQRVHYIIHLFRAFHEHRALFDPPFTAAQSSLIRSGTIPSGDL